MVTLFPLLTVTETSMHGEVSDFYGGKTDYNTKTIVDCCNDKTNLFCYEILVEFSVMMKIDSFCHCCSLNHSADILRT